MGSTSKTNTFLPSIGADPTNVVRISLAAHELNSATVLATFCHLANDKARRVALKVEVKL